jgi:hypothetical protein
MAATKPRLQPETHEEQLAPNYDSVREVVLNWPQAAQARLMHEVLNRLVPQGAQPRNGEQVALASAENGAEEGQQRARHGSVTEPPPVGQRNSMALFGMINKSEQAATEATEQPEQSSNILDIVGRWDFAYDIEDDELKQILGEARLEKYAPDKMLTPTQLLRQI